MTTHKTHTNLFHNQCLALQAIGTFMAIYSERLARDESWDYCAARANWTYIRAARHVLPALFDGVPEAPYPSFSSGYAIRLPQLSHPTSEEETL